MKRHSNFGDFGYFEANGFREFAEYISSDSSLSQLEKVIVKINSENNGSNIQLNWCNFNVIPKYNDVFSGSCYDVESGEKIMGQCEVVAPVMSYDDFTFGVVELFQDLQGGNKLLVYVPFCLNLIQVIGDGSCNSILLARLDVEDNYVLVGYEPVR